LRRLTIPGSVLVMLSHKGPYWGLGVNNFDKDQKTGTRQLM